MSPKERRPVDDSEWETESGLPNNIDAYIKGPYFGTREEYSDKAALSGADPPLLACMPLVDIHTGEEYNGPAYSVGKGWTTPDNGRTIEHPTRDRLVRTSMYAQVCDRARIDLGVPLTEFGSPRDMSTWDLLAFHWVQEEHATVGGDKKMQLMPMTYLGVYGEDLQIPEGTTKPAQASTLTPAGIPEAVMARLKALALANDSAIKFVQAALAIQEVATNTQLTAKVTDDSPNGLWATLRAQG